MDLSACEWSPLKNERLKKTRGISFEEILKMKLLAIENHPSNALQKKLIFERENYAWVVPFVEMEDKIFLKTIYPSRKFTAKYKKRGELK